MAFGPQACRPFSEKQIFFLIRGIGFPHRCKSLANGWACYLFRLPAESIKSFLKHAVFIDGKMTILIKGEEKKFDEVLLIGSFHNEYVLSVNYEEFIF